MPPEKSQLFTNAKKAITVDPIPRNIHPTHNERRRKARAKAILDKITHNETKVLFVDAARYWNRGAYAVSVVDAHGSLVNAATVVTNFTHEAEEMAIAVALRSCTGASVIYSDSRTAIRTFSAAIVSSKAAAVVNKLFCQVIIENVDEWTKKVREMEERHTKRIKLNEEAPAADTHLFHLWEARRSGKLEETEAKQAAQEKNRPPH
ncbi:hypothetical protein HPB50_025147 [Hyalomma asiaticum]|uniref:Uncharacterized protein n=1 Tax=Hyalomma asiaticum TaxID=266040 RepID=A0ACB7SQN2_HYAAI|nr:hypothetical protein HPB50_025147 [Hyalomma asiaticum]